VLGRRLVRVVRASTTILCWIRGIIKPDMASVGRCPQV
jgi:hypothetical protein